MQKIHQKIEIVSNVAIIVVAVILGTVLISRYFFTETPKLPTAASSEIKVGTKLTLADADWSKSEKTLVLALSTNCRYCTESAPFYRKLAQQKAGRADVKLIVVAPQPAGETARYLSEHNVSVDEIRQASLESINVRGTPTLIEVGKTGAVAAAWVGKLPVEKEAEVVQSVFGKGSGDISLNKN